MINEYFNFFKEVTYKGFKVRDIMRRTKIVEQLEANPYMFLPYTIQNDEKAEDIAYDYYGDPHLVWLVYLANGIINPYEDWIMDQNTFSNYLKMKYGDKARSGHEVIQWCQNNIEFYINADQIRITKDTFELSPDIVKPEWNAVTTYEFEEWKNESKRNIRLVNANLKDQAIAELRKALNV